MVLQQSKKLSSHLDSRLASVGNLGLEAFARGPRRERLVWIEQKLDQLDVVLGLVNTKAPLLDFRNILLTLSNSVLGARSFSLASGGCYNRLKEFLITYDSRDAFSISVTWETTSWSANV